MTAIYSTFDSAPQSFYFTLINMMDISKLRIYYRLDVDAAYLFLFALN
mgnify:CR=1 FL=1|jgi:hypothetical protein